MACSKQAGFKSEEVKQTYKTAFKIPINWDDVFPPLVSRWLYVYQRATNCSTHLVVASLLALTASLCGPKSTIETNDGSFNSPLNTYIISVCTPGGGKSNTYERVVQPVLEDYQERKGHPFHLETWTTAGIHHHQEKANGYGLITSDEGHKLLQSIRAKEAKGDAERALINKMWGGKGDSVSLLSGKRGFSSTSMSMHISIQPEPLLSELVNMRREDGFLDRFLFLVTKPMLYQREELKTNLEIYRESSIQDFRALFEDIFDQHKSGKKYKLSDDAQDVFDELNDKYVTYINDQYKSASESEDEDILPNSQESVPIITSKDTTHILRLATLIHIISHTMLQRLERVEATDVPQEVSLGRILAAKKLYAAMSQQKHIFVQAIRKIKTDTSHRLAKVKSMNERTLRAICSKSGPIVPLSEIQKVVKGSLVLYLKDEVKRIADGGFCTVVVTNDHHKSTLILKPWPGSLREDDRNLKAAGCTLLRYTANFNDVSKMTPRLADICRQHHPDMEAMDAILTQNTDEETQ